MLVGGGSSQGTVGLAEFGLVMQACVLGGGVLAARRVFVRRVLHALARWFNSRWSLGRRLPSQFLLIGFLRLTFLRRPSDSALLGFRARFSAWKVGHTLVWIAAPQLILCRCPH